MNRTMGTITLTQTDSVWMAEYHDDGADVIQQLLGTTILPTAFCGDASAEEVKAYTERMNPGYVVTVR